MHPLSERAFGAVQVKAPRLKDLLNVKTFLRIPLCPKCLILDKINRPSLVRWAISFLSELTF